MSNRLSIVFYVNGMKFQGDTLEKASLGGSETAGLYMAREMAKRGHDVIVFSNTDRPGKYDGVNYMPIENFTQYMLFTPTDVLIAQRVPQVFGVQMKSKLNILWQHDIGLKRTAQNFRGSLWNIDEVWGVSKFHVEQMREVYGVPAKTFWATRNGVDKIEINSLLPARKAKRLIYTARPERGMDTLIFDIMPKLWAKDPDVELHLAGYDNTVPEMKSFYDAIFAKVDEYKLAGRSVTWLGALTKKQLYDEYQQATLYVYPTNFEEVSCITAMECMANGLPFIGTDLAALPETLGSANGECGVLIKGDAHSTEYQAEFIDVVLEYFKNFGVCGTSLSKQGRERAACFLWEDLAVDWERHLFEMFEQRTQNKATLAQHFYRNEDIVALKALNLPVWNARVEKEYPLFVDPEAYAAVYQVYGKNFRAQVESGQVKVQVNEYLRVKVAIGLMNKPATILDYGCAIGNEAIQFINAFEGCKVTSVNISQDEMEVGKVLAATVCTRPDDIRWVQAASPDHLPLHDVVFAGEILEHVPDPTALVNALETCCFEGGQMIFTVPLGPWGDVNTICEQRGHVWNFERSDLKDIFGGKKGLRIQVVSGVVNERNKETLGWYVVSYEKSSYAVTGVVDLARKCAIQAPRQTLTTCMIIGGKQEGHLYKCMDAIYDISDEIIVCDTGMSERSLEILRKYPDKVWIHPSAPNPLAEGFDVARNFGLPHATKDWVLWVDSDEELLRPADILKYLRVNCYEGYSIRQHHFSAQPPNAFKPDLPVRLFRNGRGVKFFGVIHEHPETILNAGLGESTILSDVDIAHNGYLTEEGRRKRFERNYGLMCRDREKYPARILGKFLMARDWIHKVRYILERTAGQLTPEAVDLCKRVIACYQEEFLGKPTMMSSDGLAFYSEALFLLGQGLEYTFNFNVAPTGAALNGDDTTARFATKEDFMKYFSARVTDNVARYEGRYI